MRMRTVLVWTAMALLVANVFALPRTLAALGVVRGGVDPASLMLNEGCGCQAAELTSGDGSSMAIYEVVKSPYLLFTPPSLQPLIKTCIDVWDECTSAPKLTQERTVSVGWGHPCYRQGGYKREIRDKYRWYCLEGDCYIVKCCPWREAGCSATLIPAPTCQGNDEACPLPPCVEPTPNCS